MKGIYNMAQFKEYTTKKGTFWRVTGYLGVCSVTGKQININVGGFKTKKSAQLHFAREQLNLENKTKSKLKNENVTYQELFERWFETCKNTVKESTYVKTEQLFKNNILPAFSNLKIKNISSDYLQKQVNKWHKKFKQYRKVFNYACKVFDYAVLHGYIEHNPKLRVVIPTIKLDYGIPKREKLYYTKDELQQFLNAVKETCSFQWFAFFRLLAFSGMRKGEIMALTWGDVDLSDKLLTINKTLATGENNKLIIQSPKTESSNRTISLDKITVQILRQWKVEQAKLLLGFGFNTFLNPKQLVFSKISTNKPLYFNSARKELNKVCKRNKLPTIHIHGFRHTHCSLLFESGLNVKQVQTRLGHSDIQTTMNIYTHVTKDSFDKSAELFQAYVNF
ncbi:MAG: site-specific integrase [Saccharofermentanales bacterium]